jgi:hypothetical protein
MPAATMGQDMTGKLSVTVEAFTPRHSNTLRGFATIKIPELHLVIHDVTVHEKSGTRWVGLPAKAQLTRDGAVRRDDRGKVAYSAVLEFTDRGTREAFGQKVVRSLLEFAPSAFETEGVA